MSDPVPCPRCGVPLPPEAVFCLKCGAPVSEDRETKSTQAFDVPPELLERSRRGPEVEATPGPTTSAMHRVEAAARPTISSYTRTPWVLYLAVALVVIGGGGVAWWYFGGASAPVASPPVVTVGAPIPVPGVDPVPQGSALPMGSAVPGSEGEGGGAGTAAGTGTGTGTGTATAAAAAAAAGSGAGAGAGAGGGAGTAAPAAAAAGGDGAGGAVEDEGEEGGGDGFISPAAVSRVMAFYVPRVRSCYERVLRNEPGVRGVVQVRFTVNGSGNVSRADVSRNTTGSDTLAACVTGQMRTWRFPAPEGGDAVFEYPFRFGGGGGAEESSSGLPGATED